MNNLLFIGLVITATVFPLALYLYLGFSRKSQTTDVEDFFLYKRNLTSRDFANTSVGYALQMAAIFLFADWGFHYGFGGFWVPLFWLLGYLLLYGLIPLFSPFLEKTWTLHGFLGKQSKSPLLQIMAAIATIIGLWGTMMVEIDYCASVYQSFIGQNWQTGGTFVLSLFFLGFGVSYVIYGGYKATVNNERWQVPIAYIFFLTLLCALFVIVRNIGHETEFKTLWITTIILLSLMVIAKTNLVKRSSAEELFPDRQIIIPVVAIIALILLYVTTSVSPHAVLLNEPRLTENIGTQLRAQGIWALLSLFVANFFWMPVDVSTWQRISSIKLPGSQNGNDHLSAIRKGIFRVMLESPASWGLGVVFGMALKYSGLVNFNEDSTLAISKFSEALVQMGFGGNGSFVCYLYPVFIVAMIAVMLSTVDELLSAITFTAYDDVIERKQCQMGQNNARSLNKARFVTAGICIMGAAIYYGFRFILKVEIATILYTFYSSQLALFPIVIASLMNRTRGGRAAIMSLVLGILAAFITAYSSAIGWTVKGLDLSLMPPLVCLLVASTVYRFWPKGAEKGE